MCGQPHPASFFCGNMCTSTQAAAPQAASTSDAGASGPTNWARSLMTVSRTLRLILLAFATSHTASVARRVRAERGPSLAARSAMRATVHVIATRFSRTQESMSRISCLARLPPPSCQENSTRNCASLTYALKSTALTRVSQSEMVSESSSWPRRWRFSAGAPSASPAPPSPAALTSSLFAAIAAISAARCSWYSATTLPSRWSCCASQRRFAAKRRPSQHAGKHSSGSHVAPKPDSEPVSVSP
mmetsp:Transcript_107491/g.299462  ORF Transcript_107491/g.299462 Transcript_107491/m.299462 type:complete len:244 (-) Transcript_107491:259-990(-)